MKLFLEQDVLCNFPAPGTQITILQKKITACPSDGEIFFSPSTGNRDAKTRVQGYRVLG